MRSRVLSVGSMSWRCAAVLALGACGTPVEAAPDAGRAIDDASAIDATLADAGPSDAGRVDAGADAGSGPDIRYLTQGWPVDLTPDGTLALVQDPASAGGDAYFFDVASGDLSLVTSVGDPSHDFATAVSALGRVSALHGVPVEAGAWTVDGDWVDLPSPYATGCDMDHAGAWDVSADGSIVVGMAWEGCVPAAIRWTETSSGYVTTTLERLGATGTAALPVNRATVISDDGSVIAGFAQTELVDRWPAIWRSNGTALLLPGDVPDAPGEVLAISADGSMVAGIWNLSGFLWTEAHGVVSLGMLPTGLGGDSTYPNAIAANGALIFGGSGGFGATSAFVWTDAAGMRSLEEIVLANGITLPHGYALQNVLAASNDGSVVLGSAITASGTPMSFVLRLPVSAYGL
jgi:hypothetical protein